MPLDEKEILDLERMLKEIPQRIIDAQEEERRRLSKEIHDDLGQSLATLKMLIQSSVLPAYLENKAIHKAYQRVIDYIDEIIEKTREIATTLRPKVIETIGLTRAIKKLLASFRKNKGLRIRALVGNLNDVQFRAEPINLYRIVQEALTNLYHHAEATDVEVVFRRGKQSLSVVIKDNGKGFFPEAAQKDIGYRDRHGLSTMRERAKLLGGELTIESQPGQGTQIRLNIPITIKDQGT